MRKLITIEEARKQVAPEEQIEDNVSLTHQDIEVGSDGLRIKPLNKPFTIKGIKSLCATTNVPYSFFNECLPETKQAILKQVLPLTSPTKYKVISVDDRIRNMVSADVVYHTNGVIFDSILNTLVSRGNSVQGAIDVVDTDKFFEVNFVTQLNGSPKTKVGDYTHAGVYVKKKDVKSDTHSFDLDLGAFLYRLQCTNGMVSPQNFSFNVGKTNGDFKQVLAESTMKAVSYAATEFMSKFVELDEKKVENPAQFLNQLSEEHKIGSRDLPDLIAKLASLPENATAYDIVNMVTNHANELNPRARQRFQLFGGIAVEALSNHRCRTCHKKV